MELRPFALLAGKYRIQHRLGEGGMGTVYAAHHEILDHMVAIKVLVPEVACRNDVVKRLLLEARAAAKLKTDHVARVMDAGILEDGSPFMVMEYLEGRDLDVVLADEGPLPSSVAVDYLLQALEGLAHAHAAGIVHRDIKPTNLFLARQPDGSDIVKLVDFGISKSSSAAAAGLGMVTAAGELVGSPSYMAPEQVSAVHGNGITLDARADLWALGVVAYELMCGRTPFEGPTTQAVLLAVLTATPKRLCDVAPQVPEGLSEIVHGCLRRDRDQRWQSVAELARALEPYGSGAARDCVVRAERALGLAGLDRGEPTGETPLPLVVKKTTPLPAPRPAGIGRSAVETLEALERGAARRGRRRLAVTAAFVAMALTATTAALAMRGLHTRVVGAQESTAVTPAAGIAFSTRAIQPVLTLADVPATMSKSVDDATKSAAAPLAERARSASSAGGGTRASIGHGASAASDALDWPASAEQPPNPPAPSVTATAVPPSAAHAASAPPPADTALPQASARPKLLDSPD